MWMMPLAIVCDSFHNSGLTIGFTNGCFDILHEGHVYLIKEATKHCDVLIVGLNNDSSIKKLKPGRPINNWDKRIIKLRELDLIDFIIEFETETELEELIKEIRPDVLFKGTDYQSKRITGNNYAKATILIPLLEGISTTNIINETS